jgi:hypothetical protein
MTSLTSLIERIEAATEGSRELDGGIWKAICEKPGDVWANDLIDGDVWLRRDPIDHVAWEGPPAYSTSIDAVRTLLPPTTECWWLIEQLRSPDSPMASFGIPGIFRARVGFWRSSSNYIARHDDPTLALLAAILRARQTEATNDES